MTISPMTISPSTLTAMRERAEAIVNSGIMSNLALDVLDLLGEVERLRTLAVEACDIAATIEYRGLPERAEMRHRIVTIKDAIR